MWYHLWSVEMPNYKLALKLKVHFVSIGINNKNYDAKKHYLITCGLYPPSNSPSWASFYYRGYYLVHVPRRWLLGSCRPRVPCISLTHAYCFPRTIVVVQRFEIRHPGPTSLICSLNQLSWAEMARHSPRSAKVLGCPQLGYHIHTSRNSDGRCLSGSAPTWVRCRWCGLCLGSTCRRLPSHVSIPSKIVNSQYSTCYRALSCTRQRASTLPHLLDALSY